MYLLVALQFFSLLKKSEVCLELRQDFSDQYVTQARSMVSPRPLPLPLYSTYYPLHIPATPPPVPPLQTI